MSDTVLTIPVDAATAARYRVASDETRQKIQLFLRVLLQTELSPSGILPQDDALLDQVEYRRKLMRQACGLWRDRTDLPDMAMLRAEFDRDVEGKE